MRVRALLELLGVGAILALITVVLDPDIIHKNKYCIFVADIFHIETAGEFVILISMGLCIVYIVKEYFPYHIKKYSAGIFKRDATVDFSASDGFLSESELFVSCIA